jgi:hypothetical protein
MGQVLPLGGGASMPNAKRLLPERPLAVGGGITVGMGEGLEACTDADTEPRGYGRAPSDGHGPLPVDVHGWTELTNENTREPRSGTAACAAWKETGVTHARGVSWERAGHTRTRQRGVGQAAP